MALDSSALPYIYRKPILTRSNAKAILAEWLILHYGLKTTFGQAFKRFSNRFSTHHPTQYKTGVSKNTPVVMALMAVAVN
jgi:hypothetical protein